MTFATSIIHIKHHVSIVDKVVLLPQLRLTMEASMRTHDGRKGSLPFWPLQAAKDLHPVDALEIHFLVDGWRCLRQKER